MTSVAKVTNTGDHHGQSVLVGGRDDLVVTERTARMDHRGGPRLGHDVEGIPERALETVITLLTVVLISIAGLIPGQSTTALAIELLAIAATYAVGATVLGRRSLPVEVAPTRYLVSRLVVTALAMVPLIVGGISIAAESGGGLYWIVAGIAAAICSAVANAWVLLVEILR